MRRRFVIDENALIRAGEPEDEEGRVDFSPRRLLGNIAENCHILALNGEIVRRYLHQLRQIPSPEVAWLLRQVFSAEPEKIYQGEDPPPIEGEGTFHEKDVAFVRLAVACQAILVTTDDRLRRALNEGSVVNRYELTVVRPEAALAFAGPVKE